MPTARDRFYSAPPATHNLGFGYVWSPTAVITGGVNPVTGAWIPPTASSDGYINVNAGLQITGSLNATISSVGITGSVGNVAVTGGSINVANTAPIPISGVVQASVSIGNVAVTGGNGGVVVTGWYSGISVVVAAPLGLIGIDTGNRNVSVVGTPNVTTVAGSQTSGSALGSLNVANTYLPVSGVGTFGVSVSNTVTTNANITNTAPINVTGIINTVVTGAVSASVDTTSVVLAQATGNALLAFISGRELINGATLSGISGQLASNLSDAAWTTGQQSITNTAPIPFSGVVQANITNTLLATSGTMITTITGFASGIVVAIQPVTKTAVSNSTPSGASPWTNMTSVATGLLGTNANRVMFFVQNIHTGLSTYVALNANAAGTGNFNFILNPSTVVGYGGSSFSDDHYRGPVQISGGAYIAWET